MRVRKMPKSLMLEEYDDIKKEKEAAQAEMEYLLKNLYSGFIKIPRKKMLNKRQLMLLNSVKK